MSEKEAELHESHQKAIDGEMGKLIELNKLIKSSTAAELFRLHGRPRPDFGKLKLNIPLRYESHFGRS